MGRAIRRAISIPRGDHSYGVVPLGAPRILGIDRHAVPTGHCGCDSLVRGDVSGGVDVTPNSMSRSWAASAWTLESEAVATHSSSVVTTIKEQATKRTGSRRGLTKLDSFFHGLTEARFISACNRHTQVSRSPSLPRNFRRRSRCVRCVLAHAAVGGP